MQSDTLQLSDEQRRAVEYLLSTFPDCGLGKLEIEELARLCEYAGLAIDEAERRGFSNGWQDGWRQAVAFTTPIIKSATAH